MVYSAYFLAYDYLFVDYPDFAKDVYAFNLDLLVGDVEDRTMDEKVGQTIVEIFRNFFAYTQVDKSLIRVIHKKKFQRVGHSCESADARACHKSTQCE
jgi:hypothetical protein